MVALQAAFMLDHLLCMRQRSIFIENTANGTDTKYYSATWCLEASLFI